MEHSHCNAGEGEVAESCITKDTVGDVEVAACGSRLVPVRVHRPRGRQLTGDLPRRNDPAAMKISGCTKGAASRIQPSDPRPALREPGLIPIPLLAPAAALRALELVETLELV